VAKQGAAHVSFGVLKRRYEELLNRCNQLLEIDTQEEQHERAHVMLACIKALLLLLLGWTIFSGKNNKNINLLWLLALQDVDELDSWDETCFPIQAAISYLRLICGLLWWLHDLTCGNICFPSFLLIGS